MTTVMKCRMAGLLVTALLCLVTTRSHAELTASEQDGGWLVTENGQKVLFYQRAPKSLDGRFARANYVHPLYDLDGNVISEDFPADHLHHRGIFWAWHQLAIGGKSIGDSWSVKDFSYDVSDVQASRAGRAIALKSLVHWKSPHWLDENGKEKPFVRETTTITVHAASTNARAIDFHIQLVALEPGVSIGGSNDDKGYGGFSARIRFPRNLRFTGCSGAVEPAAGAVSAGPWVDMTGQFTQSDAVSGVTILGHPSLPVFPPPWVLRNKSSMQNAAFPGRTPVVLPHGKPLDLRYRLILHRGDGKGIDQFQAEYAKP